MDRALLSAPTGPGHVRNKGDGDAETWAYLESFFEIVVIVSGGVGDD